MKIAILYFFLCRHGPSLIVGRSKTNEIISSKGKCRHHVDRAAAYDSAIIAGKFGLIRRRHLTGSAVRDHPQPGLAPAGRKSDHATPVGSLTAGLKNRSRHSKRGLIVPRFKASYPTKAQIDEATTRCVKQLTDSAQVWGCLFEDDAGRAEDK